MHKSPGLMATEKATERALSSKKVNILEYEYGTYRISIHSPRELEQLVNAEEALIKGYNPTQKPKIWVIWPNQWKSEPIEGNEQKTRYTTHLVLDENNIPENSAAYVPSTKRNSSGTSASKELIISMQFYKESNQ